MAASEAGKVATVGLAGETSLNDCSVQVPPALTGCQRSPDAKEPLGDAGHTGRLGLAGGGGRQCRAAGRHADLRPAVGDLSACLPAHLRPRRRPAAGANGQLRSRASEHRRRPPGHAGPAAHQRCHRGRQHQRNAGAGRPDRAPAPDRRHVPPDGAGISGWCAFASGPRRGAGKDSGRRRSADGRARLHRRTRHAAALGGRTISSACRRRCRPRRRSAPCAAATMRWIATIAGTASPRPTR